MGWNSPEASDVDLSGDEEHGARNGNDSENNSDHGEYDDSESNDGSENNHSDDKSEI